MEIVPIEDSKLRVGKATEEDNSTNPLLTDISPKFAGNAPLWFYILSEAQLQFQNNQTPIRLGPVGGRIVGEVFIGLLLQDKYFYLAQSPGFTPHKDVRNAAGEFSMADLLEQARKA